MVLSNIDAAEGRFAIGGMFTSSDDRSSYGDADSGQERGRAGGETFPRSVVLRGSWLLEVMHIRMT